AVVVVAHRPDHLRTEQSTWGGPFLWLRGATGVLRQYTGNVWEAEHDGYAPVTHRRTAVLEQGVLRVEDHLDAPADVRIAWHLGPEVEFDEPTGQLTWSTGSAVVELPAGLTWTAHRGDDGPLLGWYSPRFGHKVPSTTLIGTGTVNPDSPSTTIFRFRS
ncbi:MAG TPA: heparinase II/III family protein, partial [Kribbella sp.]